MQEIMELLSQVDRKVFVSGTEINRESLISFILEKHNRKLKGALEEQKALSGEIEKLKGVVAEERARRDDLNQKVQDLKSERTKLKEENQGLRREFFKLIEDEKKSEPSGREVGLYKKYIEDLEWKLQTEAITLETEKRILKEMREAFAKLRKLTHPEKMEELNKRINEITKQIGENMARIEELHTEMAGYVEESNVHHGRYIDALKRERELESRFKWLQHVVKKEEEAIAFWSEMKEKMVEEDRKDGERTLEEILKILEKYYESIEEKRSAEEEEEIELKKKISGSGGVGGDAQRRNEGGEEQVEGGGRE